MTSIQSTALNDGNSLSDLTDPLTLRFGVPLAHPAPQVRLFRLDEINDERHQAYRQALANVYFTLDPDVPVRLLYLLDGGPTGVNLYFGVVADAANADDLHDAMQNLRGALEGQLPGINFGDEVRLGDRNALLDRLCRSPKRGVLLGTPTGQEQEQTSEELNFQDMDRLVRALQSGTGKDTDTWQLAVIGRPLSRQEVNQRLDAAYALSSQLAQHIRTNVQLGDNTSRQTGTSSGTSESRGSNSSTARTEGKNRNVTVGSSTGDTRGKSAGVSEGTNSGRSSQKTSSGSSQGKSWGTSTSHATNTSESKAVGSSTSDSRTEGMSLTVSTNEGTNRSDTTGQSLNVSKEITDKRAQHLVDYLDKQLITRLQKGLTKGLFHSAVYLTAENQALYQRLKNTVRATFQGSETTLCPLEVHDLHDPGDLPADLLSLPLLQSPASSDALLFRSLLGGPGNRLGTLMTADELAIVASLPQHEVQGIRRRRAVEFIVHLPDPKGEKTLELGTIIDRGRRYPKNPVRLIRKDLNKHVFITGVTGAGKTTTCLNLLLESRLPFLVIEPAKTEYRELATRLEQVDYYRPNGDEHQSLRINPFALVRKSQRIKSHAGFLKNVFSAIFPMEASMPMMVEAAILAAYEDKGWDVDDTQFLPGGDPFEPLTGAWPTMSDMIRQLDRLIPTFGLGKEFEEKYRGSLVSRLRSLTDGTLGQVLDVRQSLSFCDLLDRKVVIELEELQGGEEKALLMALLLGGINEAIRARHARQPDFRHLTLIEEAHRLLARPEPGDKAAAMAVQAFADMLAEVRQYGEGLIIADQIPAKLIPDVIKNTHTKIVHRLFAEDDRRAMGEAMMMDDEQRDFLPNLGAGEAVVFCGGWHGPAHAAIRSDYAQTGNHEKPALDMAACGARQLWRERARYYPMFCSLRWRCTHDQDQQCFADFVRDTRQAQKQLLCVVSDMPHKAAAFQCIKNWHSRWQPLAQEQLPASWLALLLDANPRPHAREKGVPLLTPGEYLVGVTHDLMALLEKCGTLEEWNRQLAVPGVRGVREMNNHLTHLARFKSL